MALITVEAVPYPDFSGTTVLRIAGELTTATVGRLDDVFDRIVRESAPFVVAEMSRVALFTSSALGNFLGYRKQLVEKSGDLVFVGLTLDLKTKLNLLGAGRIFKMYHDAQAAINAYRWDREHMTQLMALSFPSQLRFVPAVRQLVSRIARQKNYGSRDAFRIETIVDEVCNNAVEHGAVDKERNVDLRLRIDRDKVELQVVNATNPEKAGVLKELSKSLGKDSRPNMDTKRGRGLALIKMLSNDLRIDFSDQGTSVHVTRVRGE